MRDLVGATLELRIEVGGCDYEYILCLRPRQWQPSLRPSEWQPIFALHLLSAKNHAWARTVPIDCGNLGVVSAREEGCALRVARDRIEIPAGCIDHGSVDNI
jgi:hypothetical protein